MNPTHNPPHKEGDNMTNEHLSKDQFFERLGAIGDEMIAAYGKDFAMGALVLAARFIAERKPGADNAPSMIYTGETRGGVGL
jgi:hypothetical protein